MNAFIRRHASEFVSLAVMALMASALVATQAEKARGHAGHVQPSAVAAEQATGLTVSFHLRRSDAVRVER